MPVKIFRAKLGRKRDKEMSVLEDKLNAFEKELEEHGMHINNITMSSVMDGHYNEYALYSIVQYDSNSVGK
jgi:hypothetical protein